MSVLQLTHIGICVSDLERSLRFYGEGLGFRERSRLELAGDSVDTDSVLAIDLDNGEKLRSIDLGDRPWRAYGAAHGRYMVVPNNGEGTISVISTETLDVVATLPGAAGVTGVNSDPEGKTAFAISRAENKLVLLDLEKLAPAGEISLPGGPETGVISPHGDKLYVALSGAGKVAVIDVPGRRLIGTIDNVGKEPWGTTLAGADNYCH